MVQTGMTTPYTAFAQQNGDHQQSPLKPEMKGTADGGGGGGGGPPPNGVNQVTTTSLLNTFHYPIFHTFLF